MVNIRTLVREDLVLPAPWSNSYGVARSLLAASPLLTLLCTPAGYLFFPIDGTRDVVRCSGVFKAGFFCLAGQGNLDGKRWLAIAILFVVASGWRPRWTCIPHWYLAISFFHNIAAPEGGDQISAIVSLLLVPVCLADDRLWHWRAPCTPVNSGRTLTQVGTVAATIGIALVKVQVSWVYLQSGISKLSHGFWVDGTAMYYWTRNSSFGAPSWSRGVTYWVTSQPVFEAVLTWLPIVIEVAIGIGLLLRPKARPIVLVFGLLLHFFIGLLIGLWSFAIAMWACLVFLLVPMGVQIQWRSLSARICVRQAGGTPRVPFANPEDGKFVSE